MMDEDKCKVTKNFITDVVNPFAKLLCVKNLGVRIVKRKNPSRLDNWTDVFFFFNRFFPR